jgi:hypothetical protein
VMLAKKNNELFEGLRVLELIDECHCLEERARKRYVEGVGENSHFLGNELETEIMSFVAEGEGQKHNVFTGWPIDITNSIMRTL